LLGTVLGSLTLCHRTQNTPYGVYAATDAINYILYSQMQCTYGVRIYHYQERKLQCEQEPMSELSSNWLYYDVIVDWS